MLIVDCLVLLTLLQGCKKETPDYNKKANEVVQQFILDEKCGCVFEIPKESMITISMKENPMRDVRQQLIEKLHLRDKKELDSIEKLANNFILDTTFLKLHKIRIIKRGSLRELEKDPNFCPKGILSVMKPVFDKEYKNVVVDYGYAYMCLGYPWARYQFENGKWIRKNYW